MCRVIKWVIILSGIFFINNLVMAQEWEARCSYDNDNDGYEIKNFVIFDIDNFPLAICIKPGFSKREVSLILRAIDIWNQDYKKFIRRKWGHQDIRGLPKVLFEWYYSWGFGLCPPSIDMFIFNIYIKKVSIRRKCWADEVIVV